MLATGTPGALTQVAGSVAPVLKNLQGPDNAAVTTINNLQLINTPSIHFTYLVVGVYISLNTKTAASGSPELKKEKRGFTDALTLYGGTKLKYVISWTTGGPGRTAPGIGSFAGIHGFNALCMEKDPLSQLWKAKKSGACQDVCATGLTALGGKKCWAKDNQGLSVGWYHLGSGFRKVTWTADGDHNYMTQVKPLTATEVGSHTRAEKTYKWTAGGLNKYTNFAQHSAAGATLANTFRSSLLTKEDWPAGGTWAAQPHTTELPKAAVASAKLAAQGANVIPRAFLYYELSIPKTARTAFGNHDEVVVFELLA
jgi:hypothetical protein